MPGYVGLPSSDFEPQLGPSRQATGHMRQRTVQTVQTVKPQASPIWTIFTQ